MFDIDKTKVLACDAFVFELDERVPDEGQYSELGLAYRQRRLGGAEKRLLGLQTDVRAAFLGAKLNPMLAVALDAVVPDEESLLAALGGVDGERAAGAVDADRAW